MTAPADPCSCDALCPHGQRCAGGHATFPGDHWWPTCDDGCFQPAGTAYRLAYPEQHVIMVVSGCRHALGPLAAGEVSRSLVEHRRSCEQAAEPVP